ncbi:unnamed protein product [Jaminaea pallidilutea]
MAATSPDVTINRPSSPGSDSESVVSASKGGSSRNNGLYWGNASTLNLAVLGLPPAAAAPAASTLGGFNAISTVLNNPHKRQQPIDPSSSRYPALPSHKDADIRRPKKESVQSYIDQVSKEWKRYAQNREVGTSANGKDSRGHKKQADSLDTEAFKDVSAGDVLPALQGVPQVFFQEDFNLGNPYTFDVATEKYGAIGSKADPQDANVSETNPESSATTGEHHLEKLSHYSDIVEQHLLREISLRSSSFFSALETLQDLSQSSNSCLDLIHSLKDGLVSIQSTHVKQGLRIVRKQDERQMLIREMQGVERIRDWCQTKRMAELMVGQGEYEEALAVIDRLRLDLIPAERRRRVQGVTERSEETTGATRVDANGNAEAEDTIAPPGSRENDSLAFEDELDLSQIPAIQDLVPDLEELEVGITNHLEAELIAVLQADLEHSESRRDEGRWSAETRVGPLVTGLIRTRGLERALTTSYRPAALASIRQALARSLPPPEQDTVLAPLYELLNDDLAASGRGESKTGENGAQAARKLREMEQESFAELLFRVVTALDQQICCIEEQMRGTLETLDRIARQANGEQPSSDSGAANSSQHLMPSTVPYGLPNLLSSQVHASVELAHVLIARLISLRATAHSQLGMQQFLAFFQPLMEFVERTERIDVLARRGNDKGRNDVETSVSGTGMRRLIPLRSTLLNQSKEWLRAFHRVRLERAARWVEEETWSQADVPQQSVELVRLLVAAASEDPEQWQLKIDATGKNDAHSGDAQGTTENAPEMFKTLAIPSHAGAVDAGDEKSYYVVPATLSVMDLLKEYVEVVINMSRGVGTTEIMSRKVDFLKQFNSRTCQVVLGAGAMRSAGLKNITAKHLALASQSLSLFIHLIPYLRECVRRHLPDERQAVLLVEFDKLKRDYQEHMFEIHAKLVAIMGDRLTVHCKGLAATDWNAPLSEDDGEIAPSKSLVDLTRETGTLHKVLSKYLHENVVASITTQVMSAVVQRVGTEFAKVEVTREGGENCMKRMKADVDFLDSRYGHLQGVEGNAWNSEGLRAVVSTKLPPQPPKAEPPSQSGRASMSRGRDSDGPSTPRASTSDGPPARSTPTAYRSKMFPFGRNRAGAAATATSSPQTSARGSPTRASIDQPGRDSVDALALPKAQTAEEPLRSPRISEHAEAGSKDHVPESAPPSPYEVQAAGAQGPSEPDVPSTATDAGEASQASERSAQFESVQSEEGPAIGGETLSQVEEAETERPASDTTGIRDSPKAVPNEAPIGLGINNSTQESLPVDASASMAEQEHAAQHSSSPASPATPSATRSGSPSVADQQAQLPTLPAVATTDTAASPAPGTPTRSGRLTLQQRLAEAARKRSAAAAAAAAAATVSAPQDPAPAAAAAPTPPVDYGENQPVTESSGEAQIEAAPAAEEAEKEMPAPPTPSKDSEYAVQAKQPSLLTGGENKRQAPQAEDEACNDAMAGTVDQAPAAEPSAGESGSASVEEEKAKSPDASPSVQPQAQTGEGDAEQAAEAQQDTPQSLSEEISSSQETAGAAISGGEASTQEAAGVDAADSKADGAAAEQAATDADKAPLATEPASPASSNADEQGPTGDMPLSSEGKSREGVDKDDRTAGDGDAEGDGDDQGSDDGGANDDANDDDNGGEDNGESTIGVGSAVGGGAPSTSGGGGGKKNKKKKKKKGKKK